MIGILHTVESREKTRESVLKGWGIKSPAEPATSLDPPPRGLRKASSGVTSHDDDNADGTARVHQTPILDLIIPAKRSFAAEDVSKLGGDTFPPLNNNFDSS